MTSLPLSHTYPGRTAALAVYVLYILSIPSFAVLALAGVIVALMSREGAEPLARAHLNDQIRIWMTAFWWGVAIAIVTLVGAILTLVLIGFPILWLAGLAALLVMIWFTIKSVLGLLRLLDGRGL